MLLKLEELRKQKTDQISKKKAMQSYLATFTTAPEYLTEWNESVFHAFIEFVVIHQDKEAEFVFKNGHKIRVAIN